jgi:hypothetical protein
MHTSLLLNITHSQTMVSFNHNMYGSLPNTQLLSCYSKTACKNCPYSTYEFPFSLACLTLTLPKDDCTSMHAPQQLTPTLLNEFNDWLWEYSTTNRRLCTMIIILGMRVGLIPMNNSPFDPFLLWNHIPPSFFISFLSQPIIIYFIDYLIHIIYNSPANYIKSIHDLFPNTSTHQPNSH